MTTATFASGTKGVKASLLSNLPPHGILLIKDYTTMLTKDKDSRGQILGQMRKIFDGDYRKKFGNAEEVAWTGKLGMIAATTHEIYSNEMVSANASMGQRYLYYEMEMPDRFDVTMAGTDDDNMNETAKDEEFRQAFHDYLTPILSDVSKQQTEGRFIQPVIDDATRISIAHLAEFSTRARSDVKRNQYSKDKDQELPPSPEMPIRFAKALICTAMGLLLIHRYDNEPEVLTDSDRAILYKIALDSIPLARRMVLKALTTYSSATESALVERTGMSRGFIKLYLGDLTALQMVTIQKTGHNSWQYILKEEYRLLMAEYGGLSMTQQVLDDPDPLSDDPLDGLEPPPTPGPVVDDPVDAQLELS